jgi:hypothetical protein
MLFNSMSTLINYFKANCDDADISLSKLELGKGVLLAGSLVNHSCDPNMYQVWYGTTAVYRSRRPIRKGEQLTCKYIKPATRFNYKLRQRILLNVYKFKCRLAKI